MSLSHIFIASHLFGLIRLIAPIVNIDAILATVGESREKRVIPQPM